MSNRGLVLGYGGLKRGRLRHAAKAEDGGDLVAKQGEATRRHNGSSRGGDSSAPALQATRGLAVDLRVGGLVNDGRDEHSRGVDASVSCKGSFQGRHVSVDVERGRQREAKRKAHVGGGERLVSIGKCAPGCGERGHHKTNHSCSSKQELDANTLHTDTGAHAARRREAKKVLNGGTEGGSLRGVWHSLSTLPRAYAGVQLPCHASD